jgi:hypothetical protein
MTVKRPFEAKRRPPKSANVSAPAKERIPRIAKLMALAICLDQMLCDHKAADQADLARLGHVTRARMTQIMNLLGLSPQIQQQLLELSEIDCSVTERQLRPIAATLDWKVQLQLWRTIIAAK